MTASHRTEADGGRSGRVRAAAGAGRHIGAGIDTQPTSVGADSVFDSVAIATSLDADPTARRFGTEARERRGLIGAALVGLVGLAAVVAALVQLPHLDASWRATPQGELELVRTDEAALMPHERKLLVGVSGDGVPTLLVDARLLRGSARWALDDLDRTLLLLGKAQFDETLRRPGVAFEFDDGSSVPVVPHPRGARSLPLLFWLLCGIAFALHLIASAAVLSGRALRNRVYALVAWCQAANFLTIAVESALELGMPEFIARIDLPLRMALDLTTAAAMVVWACLYPRRLVGATAIGGGAVLCAAALVLLHLLGRLTHVWWWTQGGVALCGVAVIALLGRSYRSEANPFALVLLRFALLVVVTWTLLTAAIASAHSPQQLPDDSAELGPLVWYVFFATLLLLAPSLARMHSGLREFALLAAISTVATSLNLLFVSVFAFSAFAALTLSLCVSLIVYSGARPWLMRQLLGSSRLPTEHLFEQLYRVAREVKAEPQRAATLIARLVGELFEPLEIRRLDLRLVRSRVASDGSGLVVPLPKLGTDADDGGAVLMRFAQSGRRLFSADDARLTDRIVEQLQRAVTFDRAVEQGRHEERLRLAQDLHDDIGARLLTLMYQAQSPEMEEYARHTLLDLKTLTRGLSASEHRLSHAAAEWKADLTHRLAAAHIEPRCTFDYDDDAVLTVGQWSALTRVLRELVNNSIAHAKATYLAIDFRLANDRIDLVVADDGIGANPETWSHGLGLGGVRKRVKQLGGSVEWRQATPHGIVCRVVVKALSAAP